MLAGLKWNKLRDVPNYGLEAYITLKNRSKSPTFRPLPNPYQVECAPQVYLVTTGQFFRKLSNAPV